MRIISLLLHVMPRKLIIYKIRKRRQHVPNDIEWYRFYNAYFEEIIHSLKGSDIINWINNTNNAFVKKIKGISAPKFDKPMVILGTEDDNNAFSYFSSL